LPPWSPANPTRCDFTRDLIGAITLYLEFGSIVRFFGFPAEVGLYEQFADEYVGEPHCLIASSTSNALKLNRSAIS
jgi:hypothetical protein